MSLHGGEDAGKALDVRRRSARGLAAPHEGMALESRKSSRLVRKSRSSRIGERRDVHRQLRL